MAEAKHFLATYDAVNRAFPGAIVRAFKSCKAPFQSDMCGLIPNLTPLTLPQAVSSLARELPRAYVETLPHSLVVHFDGGVRIIVDFRPSRSDIAGSQHNKE